MKLFAVAGAFFRPKGGEITWGPALSILYAKDIANAKEKFRNDFEKKRPPSDGWLLSVMAFEINQTPDA